MIKPLSRKEEFFVATENEALDFVDEQREGKDGDSIVAQQVQHKSNKNGDYYRVVLEYRYNTPAGIMETSPEYGGEPEDEEASDNTEVNEEDTEDEE